MTFAKIFDTRLGQVVAVLHYEDDRPDIRFFGMTDKMGVQSVSIGYDVGGWKTAQKGFHKVSYEMAENALLQIHSIFNTEIED